MPKPEERIDKVYASNLQLLTEQRDKLAWELRQLRASLDLERARLPAKSELSDYGRGIADLITQLDLVKEPPHWPL